MNTDADISIENFMQAWDDSGLQETFLNFCRELKIAIAEPVDTDTLWHILTLVLKETPPIEEIELWTNQQRDTAADWAVALHLYNEGDYGLVIPPKPDCLAGYEKYK